MERRNGKPAGANYRVGADTIASTVTMAPAEGDVALRTAFQNPITIQGNVTANIARMAISTVPSPPGDNASAIRPSEPAMVVANTASPIYAQMPT